jgi:hypothetical protein
MNTFKVLTAPTTLSEKVQDALEIVHYPYDVLLSYKAQQKIDNRMESLACPNAQSRLAINTAFKIKQEFGVIVSAEPRVLKWKQVRPELDTAILESEICYW